MQRKHPEEDLTFASLKKILTQPAAADQEARDERRQQMRHNFNTALFVDLKARHEKKESLLEYRITDIFARVPSLMVESPSNVQLKAYEPSRRQSISSDDATGAASTPESQRTLIAPGGAIAVSDVSRKVNVINNPFGELCNITYNVRGPPLFAVQFPEMFVY
jgi:hypothetical protein